MRFDDQYDAPLSGPERVRLRALEMSPGATAGQRISAARELAKFIIGDRAKGAQEALNEAYVVAQQILIDGVDAFRAEPGNAFGEPETILVPLADMRDLVKKLDTIAEVPF